MAKGHTCNLTPDESAIPTRKQWSLPQHAFLNPNKPWKLWMVMDAKAKCNNVSLNDKLLVGPDLLNNLCGFLLPFREERVTLLVDIESMFQQCQMSSQLWDSRGTVCRWSKVLRFTKCLWWYLERHLSLAPLITYWRKPMTTVMIRHSHLKPLRQWKDSFTLTISSSQWWWSYNH